MKSIIIIKDRYGGLANELFRFANLIAFCRENNFFLINSKFGIISGKNNRAFSQYFTKTRNNIFSSNPNINLSGVVIPHWYRNFQHRLIFKLIRFGSKLGSIKYKKMKNYHGDNVDLDNKDTLINFNAIISIEGWGWKGEKTFRKHSSFLRGFFKVDPFYTKKIDKIVNQLKFNNEIIFGIHIRRADFKEHYPDLYFPFSYYFKIINLVKKTFENKKVSFLICSDEKIPDYISNLSNIYLTDGKEISDLYALSKCDYLIGVSSTFSGWASFHGEVPLYNLKPNIKEINLSSFEIVRF